MTIYLLLYRLPVSDLTLETEKKKVIRTIHAGICGPADKQTVAVCSICHCYLEIEYSSIL